MGILRNCDSMSITVGATLAAASAIPVGDWTSFLIYNAADSAITDIQVYACDTEGGTYLKLYDSQKAAAAIATMVTSAAYQLPFSTFPARWMKITGNTTGAMKLTFKS